MRVCHSTTTANLVLERGLEPLRLLFRLPLKQVRLPIPPFEQN